MQRLRLDLNKINTKIEVKKFNFLKVKTKGIFIVQHHVLY